MVEHFNRFGFREDLPTSEVMRILDTLRDKNFYAPVIVDTLLSEGIQDSLVAGDYSEYGSDLKFAVGTRMARNKDGYMRLKFEKHTKNLNLTISKFRHTDMASDRAALFDDDSFNGHINRIHIASNARAHTGMTHFSREDRTPSHKVIDNLTIELPGSRLAIAPGNLTESFDYWLLTDFVPSFLVNKAAPVANVPLREMEDWT